MNELVSLTQLAGTLVYAKREFLTHQKYLPPPGDGDSESPGDHDGRDVAQRLKDWLAQNAVEVLYVAGPRASKEPGIASFVILTIDAVFGF